MLSTLLHRIKHLKDMWGTSMERVWGRFWGLFEQQQQQHCCCCCYLKVKQEAVAAAQEFLTQRCVTLGTCKTTCCVGTLASIDARGGQDIIILKQARSPSWLTDERTLFASYKNVRNFWQKLHDLIPLFTDFLQNPFLLLWIILLSPGRFQLKVSDGECLDKHVRAVCKFKQNFAFGARLHFISLFENVLMIKMKTL